VSAPERSAALDGGQGLARLDGALARVLARPGSYAGGAVPEATARELVEAGYGHLLPRPAQLPLALGEHGHDDAGAARAAR